MTAPNVSELAARSEQLRKERDQIIARLGESVRRLRAAIKKIEEDDKKLLTRLLPKKSWKP